MNKGRGKPWEERWQRWDCRDILSVRWLGSQEVERHRVGGKTNCHLVRPRGLWFLVGWEQAPAC